MECPIRYIIIFQSMLILGMAFFCYWNFYDDAFNIKPIILGEQ